MSDIQLDLKELRNYLKEKNSDNLVFTGKVEHLDYKENNKICIIGIIDNDSKLTSYIEYNLILNNKIEVNDNVKCVGKWNYYLSSFYFIINDIKKLSKEDVDINKITSSQINFRRLTDTINNDDKLKEKLKLNYPYMPSNIGLVYNSKENVSNIVDNLLKLKLNVHKYGLSSDSNNVFNTSFENKIKQVKNLDIIIFYIAGNDPLIELFSLKTILNTVLHLIENTNIYIMNVLGNPFNYPVVQLLCHKIFPSMDDLYNFIDLNNKEQNNKLSMLEEKCNNLLNKSINNYKIKNNNLRKYLDKIQTSHKEAILLDSNNNIITYKNQKPMYVKYHDGTIIPINTLLNNQHNIQPVISSTISQSNHIFDDSTETSESDIKLDDDLSDSYVEMFKSQFK